MTAIVNMSSEAKAQLMDKSVTTANGTHQMKIINVGCYCPAEDTVYLHLSSTTRFTKQRNGKSPVQYSGWYYLPHIIEGVAI